MGKSWNFRPEVVALFGKPVAENPTSHMIEAAFRHRGLDWKYVQFEVEPEGLGDAVRGMRAMGFRGANVTVPHKVAILAHLDRLGESASMIKAVNCIIRRGSDLVGENTDGQGFVQSLREVLEPKGKRVVILGAGGAARAIAVELALAGASHLTFVNRTPDRLQEVSALVEGRVAVERIPWRGEFRVPESADVLVQATSIGLFPDVQSRVPVDPASFRKGLVVADVIPNPPRTRFLREAEARGSVVLDGLGMLVRQGVIGFKYWTGIDADPAVLRRALGEVFGA